MLKNSLLTLASLVLSFVLAEMCLRVLGFGGEQEWTLKDGIFVNDDILDYRLKPYSTTYSGTIAYRLNGMGFRDLDRNLDKEKTNCRLLVVGDSVAFGYKVAFDAIFSRRLEALLGSSKMGNGIEVFNLAIPGLNTRQESHLLAQEARQLDPDVIILAFVLNDAEAGVSYRQSYRNAAEKNCRINLLNLPVPCPLKLWLKNSALLYFVKERLDYVVWRMGIGDSDDVFNSMKSDYFSRLYNDRSNWETHVVNGLESIGEFAKDRNISVVLVTFPIMFDFSEYKWGWIHQKVAAEAKRLGFHVVDLLDDYRQYPVYKVRLERGDFVHPNALGHHLAAAAVMHYFESHPQILARCSGVSGHPAQATPQEDARSSRDHRS